jgi:predicted ATPase
MLTRLHVKGFKNLVDVELRFGPLTCIAGLNGVGKSNLFDAIRFLSLLADKPFIQAAEEIRGGEDVQDLFTSGGNGEMSLECDVLIAKEGIDDFGQPAQASSTYLVYRVDLHLEPDPEMGFPRIRLTHESLEYVTKGGAPKRLLFEPKRAWLDSVLTSKRTTPFISSEGPRERQGDTSVRLHVDRTKSVSKSKRGGGKPSDFIASRLPRTVLSSAQNAEENRTAVLLRQEMRQWRILQLEPSALRKEDGFQSPQKIDERGAHIPAALYRLAQSSDHEEDTYAEVASQLAELVDDVKTVRVDRDETRRVLRFMLKDRQGVELPASSLSDGTMRFVSLAVLEQDATISGLLCLEEPENGIHPERIDAIVRLLENMVVDTEMATGQDNPLRQVIISTHSPLVAAKTRPADLVFVRARRHRLDGHLVKGLEASAIADYWRQRAGSSAIPKGALIRYLGSVHTAKSLRQIDGPPRTMDLVQLPLSFEGNEG